MANAVYPKALAAFLKGQVDVLTNNIKTVLVDAQEYTYNAGHEFLSDIPSGGRIATSGNLTGKTVADGGVFDADDITIAAVTGDQFEIVVVYVDTGVEATSRLLSYHDSGAGFPLTPNGTNVTVTWDNGASKIFKI